MPLLDTVNVADLRPWLIRTLEPICDADPEVLADYVLALLKHEAPEAELRTMFTKQLEDFLDKESAPFVDQLFSALRSRSYVPYAAASPPTRSADPGIPIPMDGLGSSSAAGHKRPADGDDSERPPPKGPRLHADGNFSRYGAPGPHQNNGGNWRGGPRNGPPPTGPRAGGFANGNGRPQNDMNQRGPRRGLCKDYHNLGYCARGALCPYSHGEDAIAPTMPFGMPQAGPPGMPFIPVMPGAPFGMPFPMGPAGGGYDPSQAHMDLGNRSAPGGAVIQDLTPHPEGSAGPRPRHDGPNRGRGRGGRPPADQGRGTFNRETFGEEPAEPGSRPRKGENKTIVVEKIPTEHLSLDGVNSWFKRFGTVTNVAIDAKGGKALVSFANPNEAHAAWKSEDAVFGNRFVKVFWHRPMEGHGAAGTKMLAASAPLIANLSAKDQPQPPTTTPKTESAAPKKKAGDPAAIAAKQQQLERHIAEQKIVMAQYMAATSPEEKQELKERLRKLAEEMKNGVAAPINVEDKEKERLDKELDIHAVKTEITNGDGDGEGDGSTTEDLKAKLAKLREEAASLGISDPSAAAAGGYGAGGYRPYRGRGRGARGGFYRGRGAMPMRSMKLDNRPKKLLIKGTAGDDDALQTVRTWFDTMGQVESASLLPSGDVLVAFHNRSFAEQAFARPSNISGVGSVEVSWHSDAPTTAPAAAPLAAKGEMDGNEDTFMRDEPRSPRRDRDDEDDDRHLDEDESRWDDDEDDRRRRR
ncbi:hypothetical protein EXIGLDRAFT_760307 [Exidia glandulosa HHB12029]|uniref:C3H1-type domain-containing protein n=1 Tax=Exidia glandulosa HHB12029 TaxID=1314781 RepID=A0A165PF95_EXIGL|nr:hypothetical protein EXIGLDRAFT_760307 [Exidia glandulosa HHB12029]